MSTATVKELVGLEFQPYSFEVEKGKIKELVAAIGDDNPIYSSREAAQEAGFEDVPIPLTFLQVIDTWGGYGFDEKMTKLKLNPVKVLHGEQAYEYFQDIYPGDVLTVSSKVIGADVKTGSAGSMDLITTENRYTNQRGELAAVARGTLVHRH